MSRGGLLLLGLLAMASGIAQERPVIPVGPPAIELPDDPIGQSQPPQPAPKPSEPPRLFVPSEKISADSAISFPVDI